MKLLTQIMNITATVPDEVLNGSGATRMDTSLAYKLGHRDSRHAAAEIALQADMRIADLEGAIAEIKSLCSNVQRGNFDSLGTIYAIQAIITQTTKR